MIRELKSGMISLMDLALQQKLIPPCYIKKETNKFDQLDKMSDSNFSSDEDEENLSEGVSTDCCSFSSDKNSSDEETFVL